jgi:hypothetical protein
MNLTAFRLFTGLTLLAAVASALALAVLGAG